VKIAIQGLDGSYHSVAAKGIFGADIELVDGQIFSGVFDLVENREVDYGVVAIENSIFGTIRQVYDLLASRDLFIVGEAYVKLEHVLAGTKGSSLDKLKIIESQKEAIAACDEWVKSNASTLEIVYKRDTAESLKDVAESGDIARSAIGSKSTALMLGMDILAENIADDSDTDTRFVVIGYSKETIHEAANKASILLRLSDSTTKGALLSALQIIASLGVNITKIESRPEPGKKWSYMFYMDLSLDSKKLQSLINELELIGSTVEVIGTYQAATDILSS